MTTTGQLAPTTGSRCPADMTHWTRARARSSAGWLTLRRSTTCATWVASAKRSEPVLDLTATTFDDDQNVLLRWGDALTSARAVYPASTPGGVKNIRFSSRLGLGLGLPTWKPTTSPTAQQSRLYPGAAGGSGHSMAKPNPWHGHPDRTSLSANRRSRRRRHLHPSHPRRLRRPSHPRRRQRPSHPRRRQLLLHRNSGGRHQHPPNRRRSTRHRLQIEEPPRHRTRSPGKPGSRR